MMKTQWMMSWLVMLPLWAGSCERLDDRPEDYPDQGERRDTPALVPLAEVAEIFSELPLGQEQLEEVYTAVSASVDNGYDEEYTMADLFQLPGSGVGDDRLPTKAGIVPRVYERPLRDLLTERIQERLSTRSVEEGPDADAYLALLSSSDLQIYWPYSDHWDGQETPVITFDPEDQSNNNWGYQLMLREDGVREVRRVVVTEAFAQEHPVWVINRNDDAAFSSVELLRRQDPSWGTGGGNLVVKSVESESKTLILKSFKALRNYDCWFAGGSEFFVKCGSVEHFTASTEAEMRLYNPHITDFMIEMRRSQVGKVLPFQAVLVTDWTPQLEKCAFLITEDDGGTRTSWNCSAVVKYNSKSYGFELTIPFNSRDDIVWRGSLSNKYLSQKNVTGRFGDVEIVFDVQ